MEPLFCRTTAAASQKSLLHGGDGVTVIICESAKNVTPIRQVLEIETPMFRNVGLGLIVC